ncbi:MAG: ABC transporter permease [Silvibacterium sp.]
MGAGLLGRSFLRLIATSPGFRPESLITMEFSPPISQGLDGMDQAAIARQVHLLDDIVARLRAVPGIASVGLAGALLVAGGDNLADGVFVILNGHKPPATFDEFGRMAQNHSQTGHALYGVAGEGYFQTLGIPLIRGRMFDGQDTLNTPNVALISQALARQRWSNQDPIGQS